jgi:hypothetical protein
MAAALLPRLFRIANLKEYRENQLTYAIVVLECQKDVTYVPPFVDVFSFTAIGRGGQTSSVFLTVLGLQ